MGVILRHFQMEPLHVFMTMPEASASLFNLGIYSVAEAARLTGVSTSRIRRWLRGYRFKSRGRRYATDALWHGQLDPIEGKLALGFLDLMEVRFVDAFPKRGISWPTIHKAREKAMAHFPNATHPFCTEKFLTNGRGLLVEVQEETGEQALLDITKDQKVFDALVRPFGGSSARCGRVRRTPACSVRFFFDNNLARKLAHGLNAFARPDQRKTKTVLTAQNPPFFPPKGLRPPWIRKTHVFRDSDKSLLG